MATPTIKAKLVLDVGGMQGAAAGLGGGGSSGGGSQGIGKGIRDALEGVSTPVLAEIAVVLAAGVLVIEKMFEAVKAGFDFLVKASPILANSINIMYKGLQVLLRPIGDALGLFIKPFAIAMLRFAIPIYKKWREFLGSDKAKEGLGKIDSGAGQLAGGIIGLDFGEVVSGLKNIGSGLLDVASSFFGFLGTGLGDFWSKFKQFLVDAWHFGVDTFFNVFGSVGGWIGDMIKNAILFITPDAWKPTVQSFMTTIEDAFKVTWKNLQGVMNGETDLETFFKDLKQSFTKTWDSFWEEIVWDTLLVGMWDALKKGWTNTLPDMMKGMEEAFKEQFPIIAALMEALAPNEDDSGGFFGNLWNKMKDFGGWLKDTFSLAWAGIKTIAIDIFTSEDKKEGIPGALAMTDEKLKATTLVVGVLTSSLLGIPTAITTIHTIITRYETEGGD